MRLCVYVCVSVCVSVCVARSAVAGCEYVCVCWRERPAHVHTKRNEFQVGRTEGMHGRKGGREAMIIGLLVTSVCVIIFYSMKIHI